MTAQLVDQQEMTARVWTGPDGLPIRFIFNGRRFAVRSSIVWYGRRSWWQTTPRAAAGTAAHLVERAMVQVEAQDVDTGEIITIDMEVSPGQHWLVEEIHP